MTIDPRWSFFLSLFLSVVGFLAGAGSLFTDLGLEPGTVKAVLAGCGLFGGVGNAINAVLAALPSRKPTDPQEAKKFYLGPQANATPPH